MGSCAVNLNSHRVILKAVSYRILADCLFCGSLEKARFLPSRPKVSGQFVIPGRLPLRKMKEWGLWVTGDGLGIRVENRALVDLLSSL